MGAEVPREILELCPQHPILIEEGNTYHAGTLSGVGGMGTREHGLILTTVETERHEGSPARRRPTGRRWA